MKLQNIKLFATVARNLRKFLPDLKRDSYKKFKKIFARLKRNSCTNNTEVSLRASVARNFCGIYFLKKGTVK